MWRAASLLLLALGAGPAQAGKLYCCEVNGQKTCGDSLPPQCQAKGYKEVGASGAARQVAPPLTAEQRAQKEEEERRQKEDEAAQKEQKRKDAALLNTYGSEKDIDVFQARAEQDVQDQIRQSENKVADIQKRLKKSREELEFYKNKSVPPALQKSIRDAEYELKVQTELVTGKKRELELVRQRYEQDRQRYIALTRNRGAGTGSMHPALAPPPAR